MQTIHPAHAHVRRQSIQIVARRMPLPAHHVPAQVTQRRLAVVVASLVALWSMLSLFGSF